MFCLGLQNEHKSAVKLNTLKLEKLALAVGFNTAKVIYVKFCCVFRVSSNNHVLSSFNSSTFKKAISIYTAKCNANISRCALISLCCDIVTVRAKAHIVCT